MIFTAFSVAGMAQNVTDSVQCSTDSVQSSTWKTTVYNSEQKVYIHINLYDNDLLVPGQEIFGEVAGYLSHATDTRKWLIVSAEIIDDTTANLVIINDYGSEDLTATLTHEKDGTYTLRQVEGSTIKFAVNNKWAKLPKKLVFSVSQ